MKITYLYLAREILTYFLIAVLIFSVVFMMGKTLQLYDIAKEKAYTALKERAFNDSFDGIVIYVDKTPLRGKKLERIFIHSEDKGSEGDGGESKTIVAKEGYLITNPNSHEMILHLVGVTGDQMSKEGKSYARLESDALVQKLTFGGNLSRIRGFRARDWEMSIGELKTKIKIKKILQEDYTQQLLEIYRKFSIPFACIAFGLLGIPLGVQPRRSGKSCGFILGILAVLGYYVLLMSAETLAYNGPLPPLLASLTPNLILIAIGIYFLVKTARESPIQILQWLGEIVDSAGQRIKKFS
jgi:lipopolysaccharide export system permease protein